MEKGTFEILQRCNEESNSITKESIRTAMIYLVCEQGFDKITITQLVTRAGVSRSAFYRNYKDKSGVMTEIEQLISNEIKRLLNCNVQILDEQVAYEEFFAICLQHKEIMKAIFKANVPLNNFMQIPSILEKYFGDNKNRFSIVAFEGAFFNLFRDWVNRDFVESPKQMAKICKENLSTFEK